MAMRPVFCSMMSWVSFMAVLAQACAGASNPDPAATGGIVASTALPAAMSSVSVGMRSFTTTKAEICTTSAIAPQISKFRMGMTIPFGARQGRRVAGDDPRDLTPIWAAPRRPRTG